MISFPIYIFNLKIYKLPIIDVIMPEQIPDLNQPMNSVEQQFLEQQQAQQQAQQLPPLSSSKEDSQAMAQVSTMLIDLDRRLRVLEERYNNLRQKLHSTDQNLLESEKSFGRDIRHINEDTLELKRTVNDFSDKLGMFTNEMQNVAKSVDLKVIEKYLAMWNPTNFVTRNELREYLKQNSIQLKR
jgi:16S rRNA G1207 methylase RsmC